MKFYKPTEQEEDAVYKHLSTHNDIIVELEAEINWLLNDYEEALEDNNEKWQQRCLKELASANAMLESYYKAASIIADAYKTYKG